MPPFKKILIPIDLSDCSRRAAALGCELAQRYGAPVTLLHVYQPPTFLYPEGFVFYDPGLSRDLRGALDGALLAAKKEVEAQGAPRVDTILAEGVPHAEIVRVAREQGFDLVVMGTHGRSGLGHVVLGSVAERVVRFAPCPVLTVHGQGPAKASP